MDLISSNNKNESPSAFLVAVPSHRANGQNPPHWITNCHFALACFGFLCLLPLYPQHPLLWKELLGQWVSIIYLCLSLFPRITFLLLPGNSAGSCIILLLLIAFAACPGELCSSVVLYCRTASGFLCSVPVNFVGSNTQSMPQQRIAKGFVDINYTHHRNTCHAERVSRWLWLDLNPLLLSPS